MASALAQPDLLARGVREPSSDSVHGFPLDQRLPIPAGNGEAAAPGAKQEAQHREALGLVAVRVAHELSNLITPMLLMSRRLIGQLETQSSQAELAQNIESAATRASTLIKNLLSFARPRPACVEAHSINGIISTLKPLLEVILGNTVRLQLSLEEGPTQVRIDRGRLEQALLNLVSNAVNAMPQGGELTITTATLTIGSQGEPDVASSSQVLLVVSDTGIGMTEQVRARAFDEFFTTRADLGGTGLGLASVRLFVEESGGLIALNSKVGRGTSVIIQLPRLGDEAQIATP